MNLVQFAQLPSVAIKMQAFNKYVRNASNGKPQFNLDDYHLIPELKLYMNSIEETSRKTNNYAFTVLFDMIKKLDDILYKRDDKIKHLEQLLHEQNAEIENKAQGLSTFQIKIDRLEKSVESAKKIEFNLKTVHKDLLIKSKDLTVKFDNLKVKKAGQIKNLQDQLEDTELKLQTCQEVSDIISRKLNDIENTPKCNTIKNKIIYQEAIALKQELNQGLKSINVLQKQSYALLNEGSLQLENATLLYKIKSIATKNAKSLQYVEKENATNLFENIDKGFIDSIVPGLSQHLADIDLSDLNKNEKFALFTFASGYLNDLDLQLLAVNFNKYLPDTLISHVFDPVGCFNIEIIKMIAKSNKIELNLSHTRNFVFDGDKSYNTYSCTNALTRRFLRNLALFYVTQLNF